VTLISPRRKVQLHKVRKGILKYQKSIKNAGLYFIASFIGVLISLLINPLMALNLSHEDYALIGYFTSFNSIFSTIIPFHFIVFYSRNFFLYDEQHRNRLRNTILIALLFFSLIISLLSLTGLYIYFKISKVSFPFWPYAILSISNLYFINFYNFMLVELKMNRNAKMYARLYIIRAVVVAVLAIFLVVVYKGGALGKMLSLTISALFFGIYDFKKLLTKWEFDTEIFYKSLKFCWPLVIAGSLSYFFSGLDRALLEPLGDTHQLGSYNVALQMASYLTVFHTSLGQAFQPDIYKSIAEKNKRKTIKLIGLILLFVSLITVVFIIFAPIIIRLLTAGRYIDSTSFARIVSLKNITNNMYFSLSLIITGYGFTKIILYNRIIGSILSFVLFSLLIKRFGFYGAAWGQVFSYACLSLLCVIFITYKMLSNRMRINKIII